MLLRSLILKNFRGYQNFKIDFDDNLNVIVGKNDIGKSTILEALEIFFNSDKIKTEIEDLCAKATTKEIVISAVFEVEQSKKYTIDTIPTSLTDEYLLNKDGMLEIQKRWDCSKDKLTAASLKQYICANYPSTFADTPLICLNNTNLKKVYKNYKDQVNAGGLIVRETTNSEMRQAIYQVSTFEEFKEITIPIDKIDGNDVWSSISLDLPLFFLFQSDRANKDTDKEVQDPLKAITKTAIDEVVDKLEAVKKQIEDSAKKIGEATIQKLAEMNPELAKVLHPNISNKAWDSLFTFSFVGDDNIPMNKRGSGVRRMILLNYFRAEAERQNTKNKTIIYAIEEPETAQHPNHQQLLIEALTEIANKDKHQVIITTHSPEVAKLCREENLILIDKVDGSTQIVSGDLKLKGIANTLGIIPYLSRLVVCVEGENDRKFLLNINRNVPELKEIIDLNSENISIIPMSGSSLKNWIDRDYLSGSNVVEFHLYDRDKDDKYREHISRVNKKDNGSIGVLTSKLEMENYISHCLYEEEFGIDCSTINDWDNEDMGQYAMNKSSKFPEKSGKTENIVKQIICGKLSKKMSKERFEKINAFDEVVGWFQQMRKMYEN
ncbi:ATP-binding protein [Pontibacter qinzhouensis]|uniref:ATP-binding protein n=1 Tax=Pontibacter qinzhouensis TaxID=2603253 RepID=A0A5C8J292_9BACT|nr:ATP-binding protein [Pontibacter qinzhouensis]TXK30871.1 ATP-binding protein [Pontibacter qinzhouensis]